MCKTDFQMQTNLLHAESENVHHISKFNESVIGKN